MAFQQSSLFQCLQCGYKDIRTFSDDSILNTYKPCIKCSGMVRKLQNNEKTSFDKIHELIRRVFIK